MEVSTESNVPSINISPTEDYASSEVELTGEFANRPELHTKFKIDVSGDKPRFVPIENTK